MAPRTRFWSCSLAILSILRPSSRSIVNAEVTPNIEKLYFSLMVSGAAGQDTSGVVPAVQRTLQDINSDPAILPGYSLHFTRVADTMCNGTRAQALFQEELQSKSTVLAVVGCGCSSATEVVARNGTMPVISYASTSVVLDNRSVYHSFFRTIPSDELLPAALATTMNYYGWLRLAIVTEDELQYEELLQTLQTELSTHNITVANIVSRSTVNLTIIDPQHHIYFLNTRPNMALQYLCKAYQSRRYYPNYLWIVPGWYSDNWWREFPDYLTTLNCTLTQVEQVLNRSLTFLPVPGHLNSTTAGVITTLLNPSSYAADAVKALALALNDSLNISSCSEMPEQCIQRRLTDRLRSVEFTGTSGIISFDAVGNRPASGVILQQYVKKGDTLGKFSIAFTNGDLDFIYIDGEDNLTTWPCGLPPDGTPIKTITAVLLPARVYIYILIITGAVIVTICLLFNIIFRKRKVVKLTSPNLNYVIIIGSAIQLCALLIYAYPTITFEARQVLCRVTLTLSSLGHDMIFSIVLLKSWRVVYIFRKPSPHRKPPPDWKLLLGACALVSFDLVLYCALHIPGTITSKMTFNQDRENQPRINEQGVTEVFCTIRCSVNGFLIAWSILSAAFRGLIHLAAVVVAFLIRKVKVNALNDYRYTLAIIHISTVLNVLLMVALFVLSNFQNVSAVSLSTLTFLDSFFFLVLTFVPKMVALYKDPKGERIFEKSSVAVADGNGTHQIKPTDEL